MKFCGCRCPFSLTHGENLRELKDKLSWGKQWNERQSYDSKPLNPVMLEASTILRLHRYMNQCSISFAADRFFFFAFGCTGSVLLLCELSVVVVSGVYSVLRYTGFSLWWSTDPGCTGFDSWGTLAQLVHGMWGILGPGIELNVPCIGRQILIYCTTREVLLQLIRNGCLTFAFKAVLTNKPNFFKFMGKNNTVILYIL